MNGRNYLLVLLLIVPLVVVAAVLRHQRSERQTSDLQRLRKSERALQMKANPLPYARDGTAVEEVEKVLGRGERVADGGEDLLLWHGAGDGELWTLVVTVKHGKVSRPTMMRGGAGDGHEFRKQAAISLHRQTDGPPRRDAEARKKAEEAGGAREAGKLPGTLTAIEESVAGSRQSSYGAEPSAAADRGRIPVFRGTMSNQRPRLLSCVVRQPRGSTMLFHICQADAVGQCKTCGQFYCANHGDVACQTCSRVPLSPTQEQAEHRKDLPAPYLCHECRAPALFQCSCGKLCCPQHIARRVGKPMCADCRSFNNMASLAALTIVILVALILALSGLWMK